MFSKLKIKTIARSLILVIIFWFFGIVLITEYFDVRLLLKEPVKFETLQPEEIYADMVVNASINANYGAFMEEYEEYTISQIRHTTSLYYIIQIGALNAPDFRFMAIKVPVFYEEKMDKMTDDTYDYGYSEPIEYFGVINRMSYEEYSYFEDFFLESGFTSDELENYLLPYYISTWGFLDDTDALFGIPIGITAIFAGLFFLIYALSGGLLKAIKNELDAAGFSEGDAEYEYESAKILYAYNEVRIGENLTFFMTGGKPHAILNKQLVWAYQQTTAHRHKIFFKTTTRKIFLYTYDKKSYHFNISNEGVAEEILEYIHQTMPWAVIGYSKELVRLYQRDYQHFLEIHYKKESNQS
ncbi:MAG: DUF6709 family protein [Lachnospiraceae bacterium]